MGTSPPKSSLPSTTSSASPQTMAPRCRRLSGWRRELFGEQALALKHGELALAIERGKVAAVERE
jgi:hypothetical protein